MADFSKQVQRMFNRIAARYDRFNRISSFFIDKLWRKKAISWLPTHPKTHVLDLCAGTLDLGLVFLKKNPEAFVTAADFSEAMLEAGKPKIPKALKGQIETVTADALALPFEAESFDGLICGFGMRNLENLDIGLKEAFRVLKPGGICVVLEFFKPENTLARLFYATYGRFVMPWLGRRLTKDREAYDYLFRSIQSFISLETYLEKMKLAGFKPQTTRRLSGGVAHLVVAKK